MNKNSLRHNMDYLNLPDDFLQQAKKFRLYDKKIPVQYRIIAKLLSEHDYETAAQFIRANKSEFQNRYQHLLLDMAVESVTYAVTDENGNNYDDLRNLPVCTYRPIPECIRFIRFLLENGSDPSFPVYCYPNQLSHIDDLQENCDNFSMDFSELRDLLEEYM